MLKTRTAVFYQVSKFEGVDKTRTVSVLKSFKNDPLFGCFRFLIQLLIRIIFFIKSHVH